MSRCWAALALLVLGSTALFFYWSNQATLAEMADGSYSSQIEQRVKEQIVRTATKPDSVEFLQWGPHAEQEGFYRCRWSVRDEQGRSRVYDDWFFAPKDREVAVRVTLPHITHQDREEFKKALDSIAEELKKTSAPE